MNHNLFISKEFIYFTLLSALLFINNCTEQNKSDLKVQFGGKYGQIEIGGKYAGLEFHHSRPLPSRLSFYYPVANSVDLSEGYWIRDKSMPFSMIVNTKQESDTLGLTGLPYDYTPYRVSFEEIKNDYEIRFEYDVCEDIPVIVMKIILENTTDIIRTYDISTGMNTTLHTSHSYSRLASSEIKYKKNNSIAIALYPYIETDSTCLFISNVGIAPVSDEFVKKGDKNNPIIRFDYEVTLNAGAKKEIIYLIGTCKIGEYETMINKANEEWSQEILKNHNRIIDYAYEQSYFSINDPELQKTIHWSKALIATNIHYIEGEFVPMPCPAEYNFFFTHDLLLTSLGTVYFDTEYVRRGLLYLKSLSNSDNVLPHAYYWKNDKYITEFCSSSNWNHLWFIIITTTYLKHSNDQKTIEDIFPIIKNSLQLMLNNKNSDDLMYARYPDWWDIGNVYGARSYITILMYKVLQDYVFLCSILKKDIHLLTEYLELAEKMKKSLVEKLWDEEKGYLFNMIDDKTFDWHYYTGSIVATHYDLLNKNQKVRLLSTVKEKLLDKNIGVRNVMPADFHQLIDVYKLKGMEAGLQYIYINGGVWPHNNIWYALGLMLNDQPDEAKNVLKKYMTLRGIKNSPNGIPAFYEYRISDEGSPRYGEIDKPSFLWAGGFYLHAIYQLAGLRENSYNIYFNPKLPEGMDDVEYDLSLFGQLSRIKWSGSGNYFKKITVDGMDIASAVQFKSSKNIEIERGQPVHPYLAYCNGQISDVKYNRSKKMLKIDINGFPGQNISLKIVSPFKVMNSKIDKDSDQIDIQQTLSGEVTLYLISIVLKNHTSELLIKFSSN